VTERYILRNFGDPTFSVILIPNTNLKPERGNNYEVGVKIARSRPFPMGNYQKKLRMEVASARTVAAEDSCSDALKRAASRVKNSLLSNYPKRRRHFRAWGASPVMRERRNN
jgi:hypothetical protein